MYLGYFHRITTETPSRLWIDNPSGGEAAIAAHIRGLLEAIGLAVEEDAVHNLLARVPGVGDAVPALDFLSTRFPVVALSNGNADIGRIGIKHYFQANVSAHEFGVGKPDPRIFHAAAGAVDATPCEVLHIGDDAMLDVLGGLNAGMQTAWLNRTSNTWKHGASPHITVASLTELCDLIAAADADEREFA